MDNNQALDLLNQIKDESIDKSIHSDDGNTSSEELEAKAQHEIDEIIHSDPQKLIMLNGHVAEEEKVEMEVPPIEENHPSDRPNNDTFDEAEPEQPVMEEPEVENPKSINPTEGEDVDEVNPNEVTEENNQNTQGAQEQVNQDLAEVNHQEDEQEYDDREYDQEEDEGNEELQEMEDAKAKLRRVFGNIGEDKNSQGSKPKSNGNSFIDELKKLLASGKSNKNKVLEGHEEFMKKKQQQLEEEEEQYEAEGEDKYYGQQEVEAEPQVEPEEKRKHDIHVDGPATELSNDILSYERFFPGRILGNTFTVTNRTNSHVNIKVSFTPEGLEKEYVAKKLMEFYEVAKAEDIEKPYPHHLSKEFVDAQALFSCWFIEDPYARTLVKEAHYELKPNESFEFIIVLKSPVIKKSKFLITNVKVANLDYDEEHTVFAFGSLDVPKLTCPKEIMDKENNYASVKVVMRKKVPLQIFKFLLHNKGDMPINVNFCSFENDQNLLFTIKNPVMIVDANSRVMLEVKACHKYKNIPDKKWKSMNNHKLIVGKIKD